MLRNAAVNTKQTSSRIKAQVLPVSAPRTNTVHSRSISSTTPNPVAVTIQSTQTPSIFANAAAQTKPSFEDMLRRTSATITTSRASQIPNQTSQIPNQTVKPEDAPAPASLSRSFEGSNFSGLAHVDDALMYFRIGNAR